MGGVCAVLLSNGIQHYEMRICNPVGHLLRSFLTILLKCLIVNVRLGPKFASDYQKLLSQRAPFQMLAMCSKSGSALCIL